ncbi:MAG: dihydrofolate reductase [Flavobacteriales bacterium]
MIISLIVATAKNGVIGVNGDLPWRLPRDMKFFSETTRGHHVLTGRKNYESIPKKFRPLPGRTNLVITRNADFTEEGIFAFDSINKAIDHARNHNETELFIIGGGEIYRQCIERADRIYLTQVEAKIEGDTHFPELDQRDWNRQLLFEQPQDDVHNFAFKTYLLERKD